MRFDLSGSLLEDFLDVILRHNMFNVSTNKNFLISSAVSPSLEVRSIKFRNATLLRPIREFRHDQFIMSFFCISFQF
jgi:hypothetical protein